MTAPSARYRILRRLGQGGMAEVFEAELTGELGFSRKIAIKRMLGDAASDRDSAQRFLDEARIASRLHHANIVSVLDVGLLDGLPFQVLELVDGINAQQLQTRAGGVLPLEIALIIINDVAHALDHAHGATDAHGRPLGIVHRDVKPSNVLVSWSGDVKLTDFGIAFAHEREAKTEAGLVPGTRGFIAPEQRTRGEIDGRTDVFALGLSLHTLITGHNPLQDVTVEMAALMGQPIALDAMLDPEIRELVARAVTPERRDRYTAAQFADAIGAVLAPRLQRDPRGYLRQFLAPLHGDKPKAGALDQLLGLDVVLSAEAAGDAPRRYELRPTEVARPKSVQELSDHPGTADRAPGASSSIAETGRRPAATSHEAERTGPPRRRARYLVGALAVALGGAGGYVAYRMSSTRPAAPLASAAGSDAPVTHEVAQLPPPDAAVAIAVAPTDAAIVAPDAATTVAVTSAHRTHRSTPDAAVTAPDRTAHPPPPPPPSGTGFLQVVGEPNVGAKILVDGREVGYAPNKLEVARGHHRIVIVRKDGTEITAEIDVTDYHTLQKPLRPSL